MKKVIFIMALALGLMSFTTNTEINTDFVKQNSNITVITETNSFCDYYTRRCFYQNGELLGCTAWECVVVLDEIVITASS